MAEALRDNLLTFVLGGGNLFLIIKFFIERHDKKVEKEEENELGKINGEIIQLKKELSRQVKDGIRTQLLMLILLQPEEKKEILTVGETYFKKLKGNWYMTSVFNRWLNKYCEAKPEWFKTESQEDINGTENNS